MEKIMLRSQIPEVNDKNAGRTDTKYSDFDITDDFSWTILQVFSQDMLQVHYVYDWQVIFDIQFQ